MESTVDRHTIPEKDASNTIKILVIILSKQQTYLKVLLYLNNAQFTEWGKHPKQLTLKGVVAREALPFNNSFTVYIVYYKYLYSILYSILIEAL